MLSRIQDFQNKLGTVEPKVKAVDDIATEEKFVCRCGYYLNEVKPVLTNLDIHKVSGTKGWHSAKIPNQNVTLMDKPESGYYFLWHNSYVRSRVNQPYELRLKGWVERIDQKDTHNRCWRNISGIISELFRVHQLSPKSANGCFPQAIFKHKLEVSGNNAVLGKHTLNKGFPINIAVHNPSLINRHPLALVTFCQKFRVHSPKGTPVLFPLLISRSQIGCFFENLLADVHGRITTRNFNTTALWDGDKVG